MTLFKHPANNRTPPTMLFSHQTLYKRSNVDLNSRWLLEFPGLDGAQALLTTDMATQGCGEMTALISCEEASLAIACKSAACSCSSARGSIQAGEVLDHPACCSEGGGHQGEDGALSPRGR
jgi:hypothetical protein